MDKKSVNILINFFRDELIKSGINVHCIAIFGSAMNGNMDSDSDIDLIIVSPDFIGKDIFEQTKMTMQAEIATRRKFGIPMDILTKTPQEYAEMNMFESEVVVA